MEKLYIATREEFLSLIDEGVQKALNRLQLVKNDHSRPDPSGTRIEVSEYLKIGLSKLDQMTKTGELKSFKIGRQVRFKWNDVESYLKRKG